MKKILMVLFVIFFGIFNANANYNFNPGQFSVSPETLKIWSQRPEDAWFKRQIKGIYAGFSRTGQSIADLGQETGNYIYRHNFSSTDYESRNLIEIGMRQSMNRANYRIKHEQYEGTDDSVAASITNIITIVTLYGILCLVINIIAGSVAAGTVVGLGAGFHTWMSLAEKYAKSYINDTGDYMLQNYDKTNDLLAFFYGLVVAALVVVGLLCLLIILNKVKSIKKTKVKKVKNAKTTPFKIEIVNNEKYIGLKKTDRVAFLKDLKKQTLKELSEQSKEIETEQAKLKDIPADVAKYIKQKDMSGLEKNISKLENKIIAIDELIESENTNK